MFMIYWTDVDEPKSKLFGDNELGDALKFSESLRQRSFNGDKICFITMSSDNPDSVGKQGVDVTGPDYDWKKRR